MTQKKDPERGPKKKGRRPKAARPRERPSRWTEQRALCRIRELSRTLVEVTNAYEQMNPGGRSLGHVAGGALYDSVVVVAGKLLQAVKALDDLPEGAPEDES